MAYSNTLTELQSLFCREYVKDYNGSAAARRCGKGDKYCGVFATMLLKKPHIKEEIRRLQAEFAGKSEIETKKIVSEIALVAFSDIKEFLEYDANGVVQVKNIANLPEGLSKAIKKIRHKVKYKANGEVGTAHLEIELYDKLKSLELLGNHLGIFKMPEIGVKVNPPSIIRVSGVNPTEGEADEE